MPLLGTSLPRLCAALELFSRTRNTPPKPDKATRATGALQDESQSSANAAYPGGLRYSMKPPREVLPWEMLASIPRAEERWSFLGPDSSASGSRNLGTAEARGGSFAGA